MGRPVERVEGFPDVPPERGRQHRHREPVEIERSELAKLALLHLGEP